MLLCTFLLLFVEVVVAVVEEAQVVCMLVYIEVDSTREEEKSWQCLLWVHFVRLRSICA